MVERRILRAAGLARLLGVLALLAGVLAMHSAIFASGHAHATGAHPAAASEAVPGPGGAALVAAGQASGHHETGSRHREAAPPVSDSASGGHDRHHSQQRRPEAFRTADAPIVAADMSAAAQVVASTSPLSMAATARSIEEPPCAGGGCDGMHSALHGCVFILVAFVAMAALVLLYRMAVDRPGNGVARPRHWRPRPERPPPWTVLTRAELAILRI
ncbi:hypothetical protein [Nocardia asiatica]|uniref:hypothetical protein n=1 Tax=Nocardia asiatica TaxID=209252 RepID=UPI003EDF0ED8